jgi:hypothetical protein
VNLSHKWVVRAAPNLAELEVASLCDVAGLAAFIEEGRARGIAALRRALGDVATLPAAAWQTGQPGHNWAGCTDSRGSVDAF